MPNELLRNPRQIFMLRLTMNVYSHIELGNVAEGVNQLPNFPGKKK